VKLTNRCEYALLALVYLARNQATEYIPVSTIASAQQIPARFLEEILLILRRANYVHSAKGKKGGFMLSRCPDGISLAEIIRLFDGALASTESVSKHFYNPTPIEKEERLVQVLRELRDYVAEKMEKTFLSDVM
jgi:Rrf2 family protein